MPEASKWLFGHKCGSDRGSGGSLFVRRCFAYADFSTESTWRTPLRALRARFARVPSELRSAVHSNARVNDLNLPILWLDFCLISAAEIMKPTSEKRTRAWAETRFSNFQLANSGGQSYAEGQSPLTRTGDRCAPKLAGPDAAPSVRGHVARGGDLSL